MLRKIQKHGGRRKIQTNIAMENGPFEDVSPSKNGDFPLPRLFPRGYLPGPW